jgi:hypothetical protein
MPQKVFASIGNAFLRISSKPFIETTSIYIPIPAIKMFLLYDGAYTSTNVSCYSSELSRSYVKKQLVSSLLYTTRPAHRPLLVPFSASRSGCGKQTDAY